MRTFIVLLLSLSVASVNAQIQTDSRITNILINKNTIPNPPLPPIASQALSIIGHDETVKGDHVRATMYGFGIDPLWGCDFANGTAAAPTIVQKNETLCTFQARGCTLTAGCNLNGAVGYGPSTVQFRMISTEDWTAIGRGTGVTLSTTRNNTVLESIKWGMSDGGHVEYGNALPTIVSGCGTGSTIEGSDNGFRVVIGTSPTSDCKIQFNNPWVLPYMRAPYSPICNVNNETSAYVIRATSVTSVDLILKGNIGSSDKLSVICVGIQNWN